MQENTHSIRKVPYAALKKILCNHKISNTEHDGPEQPFHQRFAALALVVLHRHTRDYLQDLRDEGKSVKQAVVAEDQVRRCVPREEKKLSQGV